LPVLNKNRTMDNVQKHNNWIKSEIDLNEINESRNFPR
jgi:hypothetical protein